MDLSVSVVTYNSAHCLDGLFESLALQQGLQWELFVVDNHSSDGTAQRLRECGLGQVTINQINVGYGRAHNQNRSRFRGRHVLFLNPDLRFGHGVFAQLVQLLDENRQLAAAGPNVLNGAGESPFLPRRFYPGEGMVALEPALRRSELAWVSGCCLMIRRLVLEDLGGFDPDYFLYQEETDLCLRLRRAGYRVGWCPHVEILHAGSQSQTELTEYQWSRRLFEGTATFWEKHYPERTVPAMLRFQYLAAGAVLVLIIVLPRAVWTRHPALRTDRIRARRDICRERLAKNGRAVLVLDPRLAGILIRQVRLAVEWVRLGAFPLDDY